MTSITPTFMNTSDEALARFSPEERNCYQDREFKLPNLAYNDGFRHSMQNCLYEGVLKKIIPDCGCLPTFTDFNVQHLELCTGEKLRDQN